MVLLLIIVVWLICGYFAARGVNLEFNLYTNEDFDTYQSPTYETLVLGLEVLYFLFGPIGLILAVALLKNKPRKEIFYIK